MPQPMRRTIGIDLGTTNTVAARNGRALAMPRNEGVDFILPSVVAYPPTGEALVGRQAIRRRPIDPKNTIVSAKRVIGVPWTSSLAARFREHYPFEFTKTACSGLAFRTRAGDLTPIDIGARVVNTLHRRASIDPQDVHAVVTVPAGFDGARRDATRQAVSRSGFFPVSIIEEPVATALAYLDRSNLRRAAVYDLGGGTFDIAIVQCDETPLRVLADRGDSYLGGDDIDREIALLIAQRVLEDLGWDLQASPEVFARLVLAAEVAKCQLGSTNAATIDLHAVDPAAPKACQIVVITRDEVQEMVQRLVRRTFSLCDEALDAAGVRASDIEAVFLAGGSTMLPGLRTMIHGYFGKPPRHDLDPMHVVGIGASLAAARPSVASLLERDPSA